MNSIKNRISEILRKCNLKLIRKIGLIIGLLLLLLQLRSSINVFTDFQLGHDFLLYFLLSFFFIILAIFFQIISWMVIMKSFDVNLGLRSALKGYIISFLPKYIPGGFWGYIERSNWLKQDENITFTKSYFSSIFEIGMTFFSSSFIVIFQLTKVSNYYYLLFSIVVFFGFFLLKIIKRNKFSDLLKNESFEKTLNQKYISKSILLSTLMWVSYGISLSVLLRFFIQFDVFNFNNIISSTFTFSVSWIIGFIIIFVPSGIGIRENAISYFLTKFYDVNFSQANFISILFRLNILLAELFYILVGLIFFDSKELFVSNKNNKK